MRLLIKIPVGDFAHTRGIRCLVTVLVHLSDEEVDPTQ
jgi:hypothetical protein